ncbi:MAG: protein kinase [Planctomycetes bacterium]|nr:protein kinase [Planctomycetota bacterium]
MTRLWNVAVAKGYVTREQIEEARILRGFSPGRPLGEILVDEGFITREKLAELHEDPDVIPGGRIPEEVRRAQADPANRTDHFVRIRRLGRGGLGEVWLAYDLELSRYVAIKFPKKEHLAKFLDEALILARFDHPGIVPVHEIGPNYIVMAFIDGVPLEEAGLTLEEALEAVQQAARAVHHAHAHHVLHGDLKPGNILLRRDPAAPRGIRVTVVDFGISQGLVELNERLAEGACVGTPAYMAPELLRAGGPAIDHRCDLYSLGATLYTLLAGAPPFGSGQTSEVIARAAAEDPPALARLSPSIPPAVDAIVRKEMSRDPAKRSRDCEEFADSLEKILWADPRAGKRIAGWRIPLAIASAAMIGLALGYLPSAVGRNVPDAAATDVAAAPESRHLSEGRTHEKSGNLAQALEKYTQAIEANPSSGDARFERGVLYCVTGEYEKALEDLLAALRLAPDNMRIRPFLHYAVSKLAELGNRP